MGFSKRESSAIIVMVAVVVLLTLGGVGMGCIGNGGNTPNTVSVPLDANGKPVSPLPASPATASATSAAGGASPGASTSNPDTAAGTETKTAAPAPPKTIKVFVSGAVKKPDVYTMQPGDRIGDAVHKAGGFLPNADTDALNLADYVRDADQIYVAKRGTKPAPVAVVPRPGITHAPTPPKTVATAKAQHGRVMGKSAPIVSEEAETSSPVATPAVTISAKSGVKGITKGSGRGGIVKYRKPGDGMVNINTAGDSELQHLPGVGPAMSAKIIAYRKEKGPFVSVEQIQGVSGIGPKKYEAMQPFLKVN